MDRKTFLQHTGHLLIGFNLLPLGFYACNGSAGSKQLTGSDVYDYIPDEEAVDAWIRLDTDGMVRLFTGKMELGQGIKTALMQIAAEELDVAIERIKIIIADTGRTPNESYTAGSASIESSGMAIRRAAAEARARLLELASTKWDKPADQLQVLDGQIQEINNPSRKISYWELLKGKKIEGKITGKVTVKDPKDYRLVGKAACRDDIRDIVTAQDHFIHDLRLDHVVHARVVRPPVYEAELLSFPEEKVTAMEGIITVFRNRNFLAVLAEQEYDAIKAWRTLAAESTWKTPKLNPLPNQLFDDLMRDKGQAETVEEKGQPSGRFSHEARYTRPYHMHASIGPSCALAQWEKERLTVWTHSQGVYPLRKTLADLLQIPEKNIRAIGVPGSGCYGHNGADDVAADAAFIAFHHPGRPIRLQWMRQDEHRWEPYGSAMLLQLKATLHAEGRINDWQSDVYSDTHSTRPGGDASRVLVGQYTDPGKTVNRGGFSGGTSRNASPYYDIPNVKIVTHEYQGPLRVSALRSLGAYANVFALESFMDELASHAKQDPLEFRLRHLSDPRAIAVLQEVAKHANWSQPAEPDEGRGIAFARYKNHASYFAVVAEVKIEHAKRTYQVKKLTGVIESGQAINPDGIKNQTEGGMIQSASWTSLEQVSYGESGILSDNWATYPIIRFSDIPQIDVHVIDRPEEAPLGAGEAAQGPTSAAIANALFAATGTRIRDLPLTPDKIKWT